MYALASATSPHIQHKLSVDLRQKLDVATAR